MKKLPDDYLFRQRVIRRKREKRRRIKEKNVDPSFTSPLLGSRRVVAPEYIALGKKHVHEETCNFIDEIRHAAISGERVRVDFSKTKGVYSCGTLLLLSEIDRLKRIYGDSFHFSCSYPSNEKVEKVFQQIGLLKLLGKDHRMEITPDDKDVFYWRYSTGNVVDLQIADQMFKGIRDQLPIGYRRIVRGVEEAVTNVVHHAYELPRGDRLDRFPAAREKRWWVFAEIVDGWLHVVICDLGIGIPRSLPTTWSEAVVDIVSAKWVQRRRDIALTERAFKVGKTRTGLKNRGKGLKDIRQAASRLGGRLWLTTNSVQLRYDFAKNKDAEPAASYFKQSIMGTLIQWSVPLGGADKVNASEANQLSLGI